MFANLYQNGMYIELYNTQSKHKLTQTRILSNIGSLQERYPRSMTRH